MKKRLALGLATVAVALGGIGAAPAAAQPEPEPAPPPALPGMDVESMINHCTQQLPEDQRGPAGDSMRHMMAEHMAGGQMSPGMMPDG